jgi:hypothetical protein
LRKKRLDFAEKWVNIYIFSALFLTTWLRGQKASKKSEKKVKTGEFFRMAQDIKK